MAAKGYTTTEDVASQLGRTLTDPQIAYLESMILPAAEQWVDTTGGREYGIGVVTAEQLVMAEQYTWLSKTPVTSVQAVRGYLWGQTADSVQTLDAGLYTLVDAASGYFRLPGWRNYAHLEIDYTPDDTIPERIRLATAIVCGVYMRTVLHPESEWLTDYSSGQDLRIKFRNLEVPPLVYDLVGMSAGSFVIA